MKKILFIVFGLSFLAFLVNCKSSKINNGLPFKIIEKTYYNWTGGQPGVKGTNVVLKLVKVDLNNFKADSLYFNGKGTLLEVHIKKDTLVLMAYYSTPRIPVRLVVEPSLKKISKKTIPKIPYILKPNEAVLTYFINGVKKHLRLADLAETDKKYYP
jgi:hypothetical protein